MIDQPIQRVRGICLALPEATEKPFGGHTAPTWRVHDKIFAITGGEEHDGEQLPVWCKAPPGAQDILVSSSPGRYFVPPYVGHNGWVGVRLDGRTDWEMLAALVTDSYRMTAPKRLLAQLDGEATISPARNKQS